MLKLRPHIIDKIISSKVLLIGCSAGGFHLVSSLLVSLPQNFDLPIIVIIHRSAKYKSSIEEILNKKANINVQEAKDKDKMITGTAYFAPADYHLLLEPNEKFALDFSEPEFYCRPSIDITFKSVADVFGANLISILLSGANEDGAEGMRYIYENGGLTVVQNPLSAQVTTMPKAALAKFNPDLILTDEELADFIKTVSDIKLTHLSNG